MDRLSDMEAFVAVVESNSFAAAARFLGVSQSKISKSVASLERRLQAQLLRRTTRSQSLTPAGLAYFQQAKAILAAITDAEEEARRGQSEISGRLRLNAAAMLASRLVLPAVIAFQELHANLAVEVVMDDRRIDLVAEGFDLIVRVGELENSNLVVRRAGRVAFGLYASAAYARGMKLPLRDLDALAGHRVIGLGRRASGEALIVSNAVLALDAAKAGAGVAALPKMLADPAIEDGDLVEVMTANTFANAADVSFLHGFGASPPLRVKAFLDFAIRKWRSERLLRP